MGAQVLETLSHDRDEYIAYFHRLKAEVDRESQLLYAREQGRQEGAKEKEIQIVKKLLSIGLSLEQISLATGLSVANIQNFQE